MESSVVLLQLLTGYRPVDLSVIILQKFCTGIVQTTYTCTRDSTSGMQTHTQVVYHRVIPAGAHKPCIAGKERLTEQWVGVPTHT